MFRKIITNKIIQAIAGGVILGVLSLHYLSGVDLKTLGNPSQILPNGGCRLNQSASTSITFMASGTATTTLTCELYQTASNTFTALAADIVDLNIQLTASTTGTILMTNIEHSMDAVDWYQSNIDPVLIEYAVANPIDISPALSFSWQFASSSFPGQGAIASTTNRGHKVIRVPVAERYIRAIFTMKGGNGAVWAEFIPKREVR